MLARAAKVAEKKARKEKRHRALSDGEAAVLAQKMFRGWKTRRKIQLLLRKVFQKVFDVETSAYFFLNRNSGEVSWNPPRLLKGAEFEKLGPCPEQELADYCEVCAELAHDWEGFLDDFTGAKYFHNFKTNETTWEEPFVMRQMREMQILLNIKTQKEKAMIEEQRKQVEAEPVVVEEPQESDLVKERINDFQRNKAESLDLIRMNLTVIPEEIILKNEHLMELDFSENPRLRVLPQAIKHWREHIRSVKFRSCGLTAVCSGLFFLKNLQELDLAENELKEIAREKGNMNILREINVWDVGLNLLSELKVFNLDRNQFSKCPPELETLVNLEVFTAKENYIEEFPKIDGLTKLQILDVRKNCLKSFSNLSKLVCLQELNLADNQLEHFPPGLQFLRSLKKLDASRNAILALPSGFEELKLLQILLFAGNQIEKLPSEMPPACTEVDFSFNNLKLVPEFCFANTQDLVKLCLKNNRIESIPDNVGELAKLKIMDVSNNLLKSFGPEYVVDCASLKSLLLSGNQLRSFELSAFPEMVLDEIDVSRNHISCLTWSKRSSKTVISKLKLSENELHELPEALFEGGRVKELFVSGNRLSSFPEAIMLWCDCLETLNFDNNEVETVPVCLASLKSLSKITMNNNRLTASPVILHSLQRLKHIQANGNSISLKPSESSQFAQVLKEAEILLERSEFETVLKVLRKICDDELSKFTDIRLEFGEKEVASMQALYQVLCLRSKAFIALQDHEEALKDLNVAIGINDDLGVLFLRAHVLKRVGRIAEAADDLERVSEWQPQINAARVLRAEALIELGKSELAMDEIDQVLMKNPQDSEALFLKGRVFEKRKAFKEALLCFQRCDKSEDDPWSCAGTARYREGLILRKIGRESEAEKLLKFAAEALALQRQKAKSGSFRSKQLNSMLFASMLTRASVLSNLRMHSKARKVYEDAMKSWDRTTPHHTTQTSVQL